MRNEKSYNQGYQDALKGYGAFCLRNANCKDCNVGKLKGSEMTCHEFMQKFPAKMQVLITEGMKGEVSYYEVYCTRFPHTELPLQELANMSCRKALFEGYTDCSGGDCEKCWSERYVGDVTVDTEG